MTRDARRPTNSRGPERRRVPQRVPSSRPGVSPGVRRWLKVAAGATALGLTLYLGARAIRTPSKPTPINPAYPTQPNTPTRNGRTPVPVEPTPTQPRAETAEERAQRQRAEQRAEREHAERRKQEYKEIGRAARKRLGDLFGKMYPEQYSKRWALEAAMEKGYDPSKMKLKWAGEGDGWQSLVKPGTVTAVRLTYTNEKGQLVQQTNYVLAYEGNNRTPFFTSGGPKTNDPLFYIYGGGWESPSSSLSDYFKSYGPKWNAQVIGVYGE